MSAVKRGVAVELAVRLARAEETVVCVVGADPTDRDVERQTARLIGRTADWSKTALRRGPHQLEVTMFPEQRVCLATVSGPAVAASVLPAVRSMFRFVVVDGPSGVGGGVGIARMLLAHVDALAVVTGQQAGELATSRAFVEALQAKPAARHVDVRVVAAGDPLTTGLSQEQLERKLAAMPVVARLPRLDRDQGDDALDDAFAPLVAWVRERARGEPEEPPPLDPPSLQNHAAFGRYWLGGG
jgi:hypothetical protein